jgi:hypothetical protein
MALLRAALDEAEASAPPNPSLSQSREGKPVGALCFAAWALVDRLRPAGVGLPALAPGWAGSGSRRSSRLPDSASASAAIPISAAP